MATILVANDVGLHTFDQGGDQGRTHLPGRSVTSVARNDAQISAVVDATELWLDTDGDWTHAADVDGHRATCLAYTDRWLVGTSEAHLLGLDSEPVVIGSFDRAEGREDWYTPWGGPPDTRSISEWGEDVFVNVHVGGILRTDDGCATWTPTIYIDADVHQVATAEGIVLAACADGLATSTDRGATWTIRTDGLERRYARGVAVCGETLLISTSSGPRGGNAAVYRTGPTGGAFEPCRNGLPEWFDGNVDTHRLDALPDGSLAAFGSEDGRLFVTRDEGASWNELASGLAPINRVLLMP